MDFREKCKNARAFVVLLAALITLILNMKYQRELVKSLLILLGVIIIFYIIATVAIKLICKISDMEKNETEVEETDGEEVEDTEQSDNSEQEQ